MGDIKFYSPVDFDDTSSGVTIEGNLIANANVGIGTTSPGAKLHVNGNAAFAGNVDLRGGGSGYNSIRLVNNTTANNNKQAGITSSNYVGNSVSIMQYATNSGANTVYYGSADGAHSGISNHRFYVNADPNTPGSGHTQALHIGSSANATFAGDVSLADNKKLKCGAGNDLELYSNGIDGYVVAPVDDLVLQAADDVFIYAQGGEDAIIARGQGAVELYHNNVKKIETTSTGILVSGTSSTFAGKVGIGTTTPNEKLQVAGNIHAYAPSGVNAEIAASTAGGSTTVSIRSSGITHFNGGNVGIGTTSPSQKLQVAGNVTIDNGTTSILLIEKDGTGNGKIQFNNAGSQAAYIALDAAEDVTYYAAAGNDQVFYAGGALNEIKSGGTSTFTGNVGIGTTAPAAKLDVFSAASFRADVATGNPLISIVNNTAVSNTAGTATIKFTQGNTQAGGKIVSGRDGNYSGGATRASNLQFYTSTAASDTEKMRITTGGNVGMGTTSPENRLHLLTQTTDETQQLLIQNGSSGDAAIKFNISGDTYSLGIDNSDSDKFKLSLGNLGTNDRLVIDSTGNVGIGTTSPTAKLDVNGAANISGAATMSGPAKMAGLSQHANDVAAGNAGLQTGDLYYSVSGGDRIIKMKI